MWYEVLPTMIIIGTLVIVGQAGGALTTKLMLGTPYRKNFEEPFQRDMFERDCQISGSPYKIGGLENIPDD